MPPSFSVQCEINAILNRLAHGTPQPVVLRRKSDLLAHVGAVSTFDPKEAADLLRYVVVDCGARPFRGQISLLTQARSAEREAFATGVGPALPQDKPPARVFNLFKDHTVLCGRWSLCYLQNAGKHVIRFKPRFESFSQSVYQFEPKGMLGRAYALFHDYELSFGRDGSPAMLGQFSECVTTVKLPWLCFQLFFSDYLPVKRPAPRPMESLPASAAQL